MQRPEVAMVNAMSVDVEDYFQVSAFDGVVPKASWEHHESRVCANTERLLALFSETGIHSTFFVLGWVAEQFPALVRQIAEAGHEVASHGYCHQLVYEQTPAEFREDVRRSKATLESTTGVRVRGYRAPSFSVVEDSLWALDVLIEEGFVYDASIFPIRHDRYGIPDAPRHAHIVTRAGGSIVEAPGSTIRLGGINLPIAGGGYFRMLPYALTRWGIRRLNEVEHRPAIFYLHPWEIDPGQPRLDGGSVANIRHYRNLHKTEDRLRALLRDFQFSTISDVVVGPAMPAPAVTEPLWA